QKVYGEQAMVLKKAEIASAAAVCDATKVC
ncbi:MAG: hypothetical protein JWQ40_645, partial [Segetibacter sp.]|nr:hypothetical protein [Segetibacter sp.]